MRAAQALDALGSRLGEPATAAVGEDASRQSLARGAAGIALLHVERALADAGSWTVAHQWITAAAQRGVNTADGTSLYLGAPALSFLLHAANADGNARYSHAREALGRAVATAAHRRVDAADARTRHGGGAAFAEYDLFGGMTGIAQYLLHHAPGDDALRRVLSSLIRLTRPRADGLPGWWVEHDPDITRPTPGGHANLGLAHGISGVLAVLGLAMRRSITVAGHHEAIDTICTYLDTWCQGEAPGVWWPEWLTQHEHQSGRPGQRHPHRPSWCYGTPGIARAQQIAAIATGDVQRQRAAEAALAACLSDENQLARITDNSLCHGWAGLYQTAWRADRDALTLDIGQHLPRLVAALSTNSTRGGSDAAGFLIGTAGTALALHTAVNDTEPVSGWDACLLLT